MLENFVQIEQLQLHAFLQQKSTPSLWGTIVRSPLNDHFTGRWIGGDGPMPWIPRSNTAGLFALEICKGHHLREKSGEH
ncbi:hypothetical protein NPIL_630351 [Nephila pilipes]|uniref:Uncharacterized protein n=1 Tax=Nephila pilipes TaxID=299642 RepID=A0A8X6PRX1_NEPPI|nr:hypothetical protein NPIL_630351 [Nephila pilipes]